MASITGPNYTQIPNSILDHMAEFTPAEFKVIMAICRRTFGWQKQKEVITLSQLEEMTGLSRTAVQSGIMAAMERGLLGREDVGKQMKSYFLRVSDYRLLVVSDYQPVGNTGMPVASDYQSTETTGTRRLPVPVALDDQFEARPDHSDDRFELPLKKDLKKLKNTTTSARVIGRLGSDVELGGGGGGDEMEMDDVGSSPDDSHDEESDEENVKDDLIDALARLGVRREQATLAVKSGTVRSDRDVIACKRYIATSTANSPAAVLWSQYLKNGELPAPPQMERSTLTDAQLEAARRMREESERRAAVPDRPVGLQRLAAAVGSNPLPSMERPTAGVPRAKDFWR